MSDYLIRVELHEKLHNHADYTRLHTLMEQGGFRRTIVGYNGSASATYHLPPAEYVTTSDANLDTIRSGAKGIANSVDTNNGVLVVRYIEAGWIGLKPA